MLIRLQKTFADQIGVIPSKDHIVFKELSLDVRFRHKLKAFFEVDAICNLLSKSLATKL